MDRLGLWSVPAAGEFEPYLSQPRALRRQPVVFNGEVDRGLADDDVRVPDSDVVVDAHQMPWIDEQPAVDAEGGAVGQQLIEVVGRPSPDASRLYVQSTSSAALCVPMRHRRPAQVPSPSQY